MNFETYFNAYHESYTLWAAYEFGDPMEHYSNHDRRERQYKAFRDRVLMMFDAKEMLIQLQHMKISSQRERIAEYRKEIIEKDEEIRVLEKYIEDHNYKTILDYMEKYLEGDME